MSIYPIKVKLTGSNGNAFSVLGKVTQAMRRANIPKEDIDKYNNEATSGDYNHLLQTTMKYVEVE